MCPTSSSPLHARLLALSRQAHAQIWAAAAGTAVMWLVETRPDALVWCPLAGTHPLDLLLRFVAPAHWTALGVSGAGSAHTLDDTGRPRPGAGLGDVFVTVVVHRSGETSTLMQHGKAEPVAIPEQPEGMVADACRRALGLPTAAPPASTTDLWTLCWLDRLVDAASRGPASLPRDWEAVAGVHPAAGPAPVPSDPVALARAGRTLATSWPWSRLRRHPETVDVPGLDSSPALAEWMDDGMWARWLLSAFPARDDLLASVHDLLPADLAEAVRQAITAC